MSSAISSTSIVAACLSSFAAAASCSNGPSCSSDDTSLTSSFGAVAAVASCMIGLLSFVFCRSSLLSCGFVLLQFQLLSFASFP